MRFDRSIRYFASVLFVVGMVLYLPVAIYVPALTFNQVSGIDVHVITPIVCTVCTFYTCVGGLKAVVWTDVIQSFVMYGSVLTICIKGTLDLGGLNVVLQRNYDSGRLNAPDMTWDPTARLSLLSVIVGGTLHKIQSSDVNQMSIQRFLSLPSLKHVKQTLIIFTVLLIFLLSCCIYMGLLTYATYHDCDPLSTRLARASDQLPSLLVMRILGGIPGLPGLFVAGVFSAALSSLSTGLNSLACVISQDLVKPFLRKPLTEGQMAVLLRLIVAVFGFGCIGLVFVVEKLGMVLQLATMTSAVSMGPLLGVYTMGVCMPWINGKSALTGSIVSFAAIGWLCANAQLAQMDGEIRYPKMPVSVEGCTYAYDNATVWRETVEYSHSSERNLYHLSFLWYTALGGIITVAVSLLSMFVFGKNDYSEMDPALVAPFMRRFLVKKPYVGVNLDDTFELKSEQTTCPEKRQKLYFELRFSRRMRLFGAALFTTKAIFWLPIAIYVPALTFSQVSGIDVYTITPIVIVICTFYTTLGGLKGVVWTDVLQSFVMFGSMIALMVMATIDVGGIGVVWQRNLEGGRLNTPDLTFDPTVRMSIAAVFIGGTIFKIQGISINQAMVQRFMSLPSLGQIKKTLIIFTIGLILLYAGTVYVGLAAYATFYDCDPISTGLARRRDQIVPLLVMKTLGRYSGLAGLFVSGVFSAALSSLSTLLNSLSAVILEDFVKPRFVKQPLSERGTAIVMRSVVVFFGLSSIGLVYVVERLGMVMQLSATLQSVVYGPMLGIFTTGMLMPWINEKCVLSGTVVSVLCLAWIVIKAQLESLSGAFRHPKLPVTIEGCDYDFDHGRYANSTAEYQPTKGSEIYHVSFLWYVAIGATITMVVANAATVLFGRNEIADVDERLLAPFVARWLKKRRYRAVQTAENVALGQLNGNKCEN